MKIHHTGFQISCYFFRLLSFPLGSMTRKELRMWSSTSSSGSLSVPFEVTYWKTSNWFFASRWEQIVKSSERAWTHPFSEYGCLHLENNRLAYSYWHHYGPQLCPICGNGDIPIRTTENKGPSHPAVCLLRSIILFTLKSISLYVVASFKTK